MMKLVILPEAAETDIKFRGLSYSVLKEMSVDSKDSNDHLIHKTLLAGEIIIVENLSLTGVSAR